MNKPKFTPVPWHVEDNGLCVSDSNGVVLFLSDRPYGDETDRADINLAAAAPEMYAELEDILNALENLPQFMPGVDLPAVFDKKIELRKLLRKARGESDVKE